MRRFRHVFCISFVLVFVFSCSVFASELGDLPTLTLGDKISSEEEQSDLEKVINLDEEFSILAKAAPVTPSTSNGFHSVIISLLGNYEPITVDYEYRQGSNTYVSHNITTDPDWSWICSAAIFALVIFCTFRFIGGIFKHD